MPVPSQKTDNHIVETSAYDKKFNLRLPAAVFGRVEELGEKYERSVNQQIVYMLKTWQEPSSVEERLARLEEQVLGASPKKSIVQDGEAKAAS